MNCLPKTGSKHSLYSWLPSGMNTGIYTNEARTLINYTQFTICTQSRAFSTLFNLEYHAIMDHIQFDMTQCVTTQSWITFDFTQLNL